MISSAVGAAGSDEGWMSAVRSQIGNQASLDARNYG